MSKILASIQAEHVRQAIDALGRGIDHGFGASRDYDVLLDGSRYPPKAVIGLAAQFATGNRLGPSDFSSGIGPGQACRVLHDLDFRIVGKYSDEDVFAKPRFIPGQIYRRAKLHDEYGGQRQGGISTPKGHPFIFLITGDTGSQYGYTDGFRDDGMFWYTGEGQVGNMEMVRGNAAIMNHNADGKTLHIFQNVDSGSLQYVGEASYIDHHNEVAPDREGNARQAIVFELAMMSGATGTEAPSIRAAKPKERTGLWSKSLESLRELAIADAPAESSPKKRKAVVRRRSEAVRVYVLRRADGTCEGCDNPAPFETSDGKPYLEPHHTRRLADGGPDHPRWVAAVCPNCHARVHYGEDGDEFNSELIERLGELEADS